MSVNLFLRVPIELKRTLEETSKARGKSMNQLAIEVLNSSLGVAGEVGEVDEETLMWKKYDGLCDACKEERKKNFEELMKCSKLMDFYKLSGEERRNPMNLLDRVLKDFEENHGEWIIVSSSSLGGQETIKFDDDHGLVRCLRIADEYCSLLKERDLLLKKLLINRPNGLVEEPKEVGEEACEEKEKNEEYEEEADVKKEEKPVEEVGEETIEEESAEKSPNNEEEWDEEEGGEEGEESEEWG